jgi:hypothetical protein
MTNPNPRTDPVARAYGLAVVIGGAVMVAGALVWGRAGLIAATVGTVLSMVNIWALARLARQAVAQAAGGEGAAPAPLTAALTAKTAVLLSVVLVLTRTGRIETTPFALGLLVSAFAFLGMGAWTALKAE